MLLKGPLASLERHDRPAFEGRSGSERSTEPGSSAKTVASQPVVGYRTRSRTAKKEILVNQPQELQQFMVAVFFHARADQPAVERVQCGKQRSRAIAFVVVGPGPGPPLFSGKPGCVRSNA